MNVPELSSPPIMLTIASASGNTFAYVWAEHVPADFQGSLWAQLLCARQEGPALDGLFLLHPFREGAPWVMEHWDPDGARTFCSNGTRAAMRILSPEPRGLLPVESGGHLVTLRIEDDGVGLRLPSGQGFGLRSPGLALDLPHVFGWTGTPHLVIEVPDVDAVDLPVFAPPWRHHATFPEGVNVSILQVTDPKGRARIRSWERGVEGETLCCGQGNAVAGAWLAQRTGVVRWHIQPRGEDPVIVTASMRSDDTWDDLWISGPVRLRGSMRFPGER